MKTVLIEYERLKPPWHKEHPFCQFPGCKRPAHKSPHHIYGRGGPGHWLLNAVQFWAAICLQHHDWVHEEIEAARLLGLLAKLGEWNVGPNNVITDTQRLDWLEKQSNGQPWAARKSSSGRGYRLHNTSGIGVLCVDGFAQTAREAIDQAMEELLERGLTSSAEGRMKVGKEI